MIPVTFASEAVFLLPYVKAWTSSPQVKLSLIADESRAAEAVEARRAHAAFLRAGKQFTLTLTEGERVEFTAALRLLKNSRVLCPFWPCQQPATAAELPPLSTGIWLIAERDLSSWEVSTTGTAEDFEPSEDAFRVPLMLGVFDAPPDPTADDAGTITCDIKFHEDGPAEFALMPEPSTGSPGPTLTNGLTPRVFPLWPEWSVGPSAGGAIVELSRESIGFGREAAETFHPQPSARPLKFGFTTETAAEISDLLGFFLSRQGSVESFWLPGALNEAQLVANTAGAVISLDRVAQFVVGEYIALLDLEFDETVIRKINAIDLGAKTLTLASTPGAHAAAYTRVVHAVLARFKTAEISLKFSDTQIAAATISFVEVPTEYSDAAGEEIGVTHGALPRKAWLYRFRRRYPGGSIFARFTSDERPVQVGTGEDAEIYAKDKTIQFEHTSIPDLLDFENASVDLSARVFPGNPLSLLLPNQLERPLECEILECYPDQDNVATTAASKWIGKVTKPSFDGPMISVQLIHILSELGRNVPTAIVGPNCIWKLYSEACGALLADFTEDVSIVSIDGLSVVIAVTGDFEEGYFSFGRIWTGSAETYQSRSIFNSSASAAGRVTLLVSLPFSGDVAAADAQCAPGCDKLPATCSGRFDNYRWFFGGRYVPVGNPSLVKVVQNQTAGGKK